MRLTIEQFQEAVIGQDDDNDYSESGYVAGIHDGVAFIARYSHCSCYDTFASLCGGSIGDYFSEGTISCDWTGTPDELKAMAEACRDPAMPDRVADASDYDYDHLIAVYSQVRSHFSKPEQQEARDDE